MIVFPILYIAFGIITTIILHDKPVSDPKAAVVHRAISFAVTAWPIVFAAIVAQALKALAAWRVEQGIRLMRLEQLISTHTVASAIKQPFFLRKIDLVSIGLLALWAISPLGSQAIQKIVTTVDGLSDGTMSLYYVDTTGSNIALGYSTSQFASSFNATVDLMYGSALLPTDDVSASWFVDTYSNPLIPVFEELQKPDSYQVNDWVKVDWDLAIDGYSVPPDFSAIFGIPFQNFVGTSNEDGEMTMEISSSYLSFTCSAPETMTWQQIDDLNVTFDVSASGTLFMHMSDMSDPEENSNGTFLFASVTEYPNTSLQCTGTQSNTTNMVTGETVVGCYNSTAAFSNCTFSRTWVDSQLDCNPIDIGCMVTQMRITPGSHTLTPMENLAQKMVQAEPLYFPRGSTFTERYIMNSSTALGPVGSYSGLVNIATLDVDDFTAGLATLVNTYWQIGFSPIHITGGAYASNGYNGVYEYIKEVTGNYTDTSAVYVVQKGWFAVFFICVSLLLTTGVAAVLFESWTVGPDLLGYSALIARQSAHMRIPDDLQPSSALGNAERARRLRDLNVMVQDVRGDHEVGKIALGTVNKNSQRLRAGRLYH